MNNNTNIVRALKTARQSLKFNQDLKQYEVSSYGRELDSLISKFDNEKETNYQHFFGNKLIADTVMLLTWDNHQRAECRKFKQILKEMHPAELMKWLSSEYDGEFNW